MSKQLTLVLSGAALIAASSAGAVFVLAAQHDNIVSDEIVLPTVEPDAPASDQPADATAGTDDSGESNGGADSDQGPIITAIPIAPKPE